MQPRVVAVIDLKGGLAVHARGGRRQEYRPIQSVLCDGADPLRLARAYRDALGLTDVYVADLDAIAGAPPWLDFYEAATGEGLRLIVDAGIASPRRRDEVLASGVSAVVLATESLDGPATLRALVRGVEPGRWIFGLDLRAGRSVVAAGAFWPADMPMDLIDSAVAIGCIRVLVLDLAGIGSGAGVASLAMASEVVRRHPRLEVAIGGGVAGRADLEAVAQAGVHALLVGSAFHDGRLGRDDLG